MYDKYFDDETTMHHQYEIIYCTAYKPQTNNTVFLQPYVQNMRRFVLKCMHHTTQNPSVKIYRARITLLESIAKTRIYLVVHGNSDLSKSAHPNLSISQ